jgi:hypothetical protein
LIELKTALNIVRVIRNTIDVIIGLSLMIFSKSIAARIKPAVPVIDDDDSDESCITEEGEKNVGLNQNDSIDSSPRMRAP